MPKYLTQVLLLYRAQYLKKLPGGTLHELWINFIRYNTNPTTNGHFHINTIYKMCTPCDTIITQNFQSYNKLLHS